MKRRTLLTSAALILLLLACAVVALLYATRPDPLARAFAQLKVGITVEEVNAVVGQRPDPTVLVNGEHSPGFPDPRWGSATTLATLGAPAEHLRAPYHVESWTRNDHMIAGIFNPDGKLLTAELATARKPSLFERMRDWLGV